MNLKEAILPVTLGSILLWAYKQHRDNQKPTNTPKGSPNKKKSNQIQFFYLPGCPFCSAVQDVLDENKFAYKLIDISFPQNRKIMMQKRHNRKTTVPFVIIDGKPMDESSQIIQYLNRF